jgi:hypothetical protein
MPLEIVIKSSMKMTLQNLAKFITALKDLAKLGAIRVHPPLILEGLGIALALPRLLETQTL